MSKHIHIRETVGFDIKDVKDTNSSQVTEAKDETNEELPKKISTVVEAIHSGLTKNYTFYPADNLRDSVESWVRPHEKPVIKNHDVYEEPVGRVKAAEFKNSQLAHDKHTIQLELEINDPETIQKVMDGRYQTLSIGGSTTSAICSVCGKDLVKEGYCGHMKGRAYDGKKAHWIIGAMEFDEISWVNVPADSHAQVVTKDATIQEESTSSKGGDQVADQTKVDKHSEGILDQIDSIRVTASAEEDKDSNSNPEQQKEKEQDQDTKTPEDKTEVTEEETSEKEDDSKAEPTLEEKVSQLESEVKTLTDAKEEAEGKVTTLTEERDALQGQVETLEARVKELEGDLETSESENKTLVKQNVNLATYVHKSLAESVASLEVVLGKTEEDNMDAKVSELAKESSRSLKEKVAQLTKEKPQRIIQTVENPGGKVEDAHDTKDDDTEEIKESTKQDKKEKLSIEEYADKLSKAFNRKIN